MSTTPANENESQAIAVQRDEAGRFVEKPPWSPMAPGQSGNPAGRPKRGAVVEEWLDQMSDWTADDLIAAVKDRKSPQAKVEAAIQSLHARELPDLADFQPYLDGATLDDLRKRGIDTRSVKKAKVRKRTHTDKDGGSIETVEREIELHDRSGPAFDRIMDRTVGKPLAKVQTEHTDGRPHELQAAELLLKLAAVTGRADLKAQAAALAASQAPALPAPSSPPAGPASPSVASDAAPAQTDRKPD